MRLLIQKYPSDVLHEVGEEWAGRWVGGFRIGGLTLEWKLLEVYNPECAGLCVFIVTLLCSLDISR